jgi:hypothetical protein
MTDTKENQTDHVQVAPVIQAFEILSDRVSNLEDGVNLLIGHARHRESRTHGELDHRLLGVHCPVTRHPCGLLEHIDHDPALRHENAADARVSAALFEYTGLDKLHQGHGGDDFCRRPCASNDHLTPSEATRVAGYCCTGKAAGMHTTHEWVCQEIFARKLEHARLGSAVLGRCVTFLPCFKGDNVALLVTCGLAVNFCDLLAETTRVLMTVSGKRPDAVVAYDCLPESILDYQMVCARLYSGNSAHRCAADSFCQRHKVAVRLLEQHPFFAGVVDNLPRSWVAMT